MAARVVLAHGLLELAANTGGEPRAPPSVSSDSTLELARDAVFVPIPISPRYLAPASESSQVSGILPFSASPRRPTPSRRESWRRDPCPAIAAVTPNYTLPFAESSIVPVKTSRTACSAPPASSRTTSLDESVRSVRTDDTDLARPSSRSLSRPARLTLHQSLTGPPRESHGPDRASRTLRANGGPPGQGPAGRA